MTLAVAVDVLPCLGVGEGELIGHGAQDRAMFEVKLMDIKGPSSTEDTPDAVDLHSGSAPWSPLGGVI